MKRIKRAQWLLVSAAGMALSSMATAQYRVGTDGWALDASNRVGSGGYNQAVALPNNITTNNYLNNELITGNITGGSQFRGFVPYKAPDAFRGPTAGGLSDRFISGSSGAPYGGVPQNNAQVERS